MLALAKDERDAIVEAGRGDVPLAAAQHVLAQVDARDPSLGPVGQIEGDTRRARSHVEHRGRADGRDVVDHLPPPSAILAEREHGGEAVIASRQAREERPGDCRRRGWSGSSVHPVPFGWATL